MKFRLMCQSLLSFVLLTAFATSTARAQVDFGDHRSETLVTKAWNALGSGDLATTLIYVNKCISMYEAEAVKMQAAWPSLPANEPKEETFKRWALNDVGTAYFIKGEVLLKQGDTAGARAAFEACATKFPMSRCWDPKGWFWGPGDAAKQKAVELGFDAQ